MDGVRSFRLCRSYDDGLVALGRDQTLHAEYTIHRDDEAIRALDIPADARIMWFNCRALSRDQRRRVDERLTDNSKREAAFRFSVQSIEIPLDDGRTTTVSVTRPTDKSMIPDSCLDELEEKYSIGDPDIWDIGSGIIARSFRARGQRPRSPVPDFSAAATQSAINRHAARQKASLTTEEYPLDSAPSKD